MNVSNDTYQVQESKNNSYEDKSRSPFSQFKQEFQSVNMEGSNRLPDSVAHLENAEEMKQEFFVSGGESLLSKMGGLLLAKAFLPTSSHIKQALAYLDFAVKVELVLTELSSTLFWFSLWELALFTLSMLLFFTDATEMINIWFHLAHIPRAIIGFLLMTKLPKTHQLAANFSIPLDKKFDLESIMNYIQLAARDSLNLFTVSTKGYLITYIVLTVLCLTLDLIEFFIVVQWFARIQSAFADLALVSLASIFLFIDWFYIMWLFSLSYKFPDYISLGFSKGLIGLMESLHSSIGRVISSQKSNYESQYQIEKNKYDYLSGANQQHQQLSQQEQQYQQLGDSKQHQQPQPQQRNQQLQDYEEQQTY